MIIKEYQETTDNLQLKAVAAIEAMVQPMDAWDEETLNELLIQGSYYLLLAITETGKVVGYCLYQILFEQAEILRIGTHSDYQRQGIASGLFSALHETLMKNNVMQLMLEVRADNSAAINLYDRQGFKKIHCRKGYYQQPNLPSVDALILQLSYQ